MRVLVIAASTDGYRDPAANRVRTRAVIRAMERAPAARLVIVPAGYWTARRDREVNDVIAEVMNDVFGSIGSRTFTLLGGVDARPLPDSERIPSRVKHVALPFYAFALHDGDAAGPWRQVSTTSATAPLTPARALDDLPERVLELDGRRFLPVICGEMHNRAVRDRLASIGMSLVPVLGHAGLGQGLVPTLSAIHTACGAPVIHTQHLAPNSSGSHHWIDQHGTAHHAPLARRQADDEATSWLSARSVSL